MFLTVNQIIAWHDDEANTKWDERVLHISAETREVVVIDVNAKDAMPIFRTVDELNDELRKGNAIILEGDAYAPRHFTEEELDSRKLRKVQETA